MKKVYVLTLVVLLLGSTKVFSQSKGNIHWSFRFAPGLNVASVKDPDPTPSGVHYVADGLTTKEGNVGGVSLGANLEYFVNENFAFTPGLWFTTKNIFIRNRDGGYSGVSKYNLVYLQVPLIGKYYTQEIIDNLKLVFAFGPTLDFKLSENVNGGDGAHYWNLAKNEFWDDPSRGRNGDNRPQSLFNPFDLGLFFSAGADYALNDKISLYAGLSLNKGLVNMIHPNLKFNDPFRTKVNSSVKIRSNIIALDFGVKF
jgi:hypothetical protein